MLKMFGTFPDGRPLVVLGLTGENMTRLMAGEPLRVALPEAAGYIARVPSVVIAIIGGRDDAQLAAQVASSPVAAYLAAHPPTPGRAVAVVADEAAGPAVTGLAELGDVPARDQLADMMWTLVAGDGGTLFGKPVEFDVRWPEGLPLGYTDGEELRAWARRRRGALRERMSGGGRGGE